MTHDPTCLDEYERPGGRQPGDRIVRCGLPAGHLGDHREDETEATWPDQPRRPDRRSAELDAAFQAGVEQGRREQATDDGICGDRAPDLCLDDCGALPVWCTLRIGHQSKWHEEVATGARWRHREEPAGGPT